MPKTPPKDLSIYDDEPIVVEKSGNSLPAGGFSIGTSIMNGYGKVIEVAQNCQSFGQYIKTPEGAAKLGTTLLSPFVGAFLVRRNCSKLVRFGTPLATGTAVAGINFPDTVKDIFFRGGVVSSNTCRGVMKNQKRLYKELEDSNCKVEDETPCILPGPFTMESEDDEIRYRRNYITMKDEVKEAFKSREKPDGITKHKLIIHLKENQTLGCDCDKTKKEKFKKELDDFENCQVEKGIIIRPDDCGDSCLGDLDYGQSIPEDQDMFASRERK